MPQVLLIERSIDDSLHTHHQSSFSSVLPLHLLPDLHIQTFSRTLLDKQCHISGKKPLSVEEKGRKMEE